MVLQLYLFSSDLRGAYLVRWNKRLILNAICYLVTTGCQWRMLPKDFLLGKSAYSHYGKWCQEEKWFLIHRALHQQLPQKVGRQAQPSPAIIGSQSVPQFWLRVEELMGAKD